MKWRAKLALRWVAGPAKEGLRAGSPRGRGYCNRAEFLWAAPHERTAERIGHANGFKAKTLNSRLGRLALAIPQVRALASREPLSWYPQALERGLRSERALKLAIAEM